MRINISKTLKLWEVKNYFKKLFWLILAVFAALNIFLFYFLNGVIYFLTIIIWNIVLFWLMIPVTIWIWKTFLIDTWIDIADEIKDNILNTEDKKSK